MGSYMLIRSRDMFCSKDRCIDNIEKREIMASLHGISIKGLKRFMSQEGPLWKGTLYLSGVKIGVWENDSHGGPDLFRIDVEKYSSSKLMAEFAKLKPDCEYFPEDNFMMELVDLTLTEGAYKKAVKKGYDLLIELTDTYSCIYIGVASEGKTLSDDDIFEKEKNIIARNKKKLKKETDRLKHVLKVYRGLDDFVVGDPIDRNNILRDA